MSLMHKKKKDIKLRYLLTSMTPLGGCETEWSEGEALWKGLWEGNTAMPTM